MTKELFIEGRLHVVKPKQDIKESFSKREFVIETEENYPQFILFELTKEHERIDAFQLGQRIRVYFNLKGRQWQDKFFTNLQAWRMESADIPVAQGPNNPYSQPMQQGYGQPYGQPMQQGYGQPHNAYGQPMQPQYIPNPQQQYAPNPQQQYAPPANNPYAPPQHNQATPPPPPPPANFDEDDLPF